VSPQPFQDPDTVRALYQSADRQRERTAALTAAKISGANPNAVLVELARRHAPAKPRLVEVGPGRGGALVRLSDELSPARLVAVDFSTAMLRAARERVGPALITVLGDFHHLALADETFELAIAAFCLYHSSQPEVACSELARCVTPKGVVLIATKSQDSYAELDDLVATSGLDPAASDAVSLYASCHSDSFAAIAQTALAILELRHDKHEFLFSTPEHAARYIVTSPKYDGCSDIAVVTDRLRAVWPRRGLHCTSKVSYLAGRPL
jgi:ubiquinone/menaquinone biosynthesis C-methylase UbiE